MFFSFASFLPSTPLPPLTVDETTEQIGLFEKWLAQSFAVHVIDVEYMGLCSFVNLSHGLRDLLQLARVLFYVFHRLLSGPVLRARRTPVPRTEFPAAGSLEWFLQQDISIWKKGGKKLNKRLPNLDLEFSKTEETANNLAALPDSGEGGAAWLPYAFALFRILKKFGRASLALIEEEISPRPVEERLSTMGAILAETVSDLGECREDFRRSRQNSWRSILQPEGLANGRPIVSLQRWFPGWEDEQLRLQGVVSACPRRPERHCGCHCPEHWQNSSSLREHTTTFLPAFSLRNSSLNAVLYALTR